MITCDPPLPRRHGSAAEVAELADLALILDSDVHIAIWRRPTDRRITDLLARPESRLTRPSRLVARSADPALARRIAGLVPEAATRSDPTGATTLAADAYDLCGAFAELVAADELMISLEEPDEATCPRFHVDKVGIRMLVTYCGPGTEWLTHEHVDRRWLGEAGMDRPDEQDGAMRPGATVQRAPTFAVVLLKGEAWPGARGFGAVHRSPDPGREPRTLLRVDMLSQQPLGIATTTTETAP
ncbi:MAG: DUF1826 domain-containing protein [Planctomycetota bacterium]